MSLIFMLSKQFVFFAYLFSAKPECLANTKLLLSSFFSFKSATHGAKCYVETLNIASNHLLNSYLLEIIILNALLRKYAEIAPPLLHTTNVSDCGTFAGIGRPTLSADPIHFIC